MGRVVTSINDINAMNYLLNTSVLSPGVYFVRINDNLGHIPAVRKVIVE
jgi:hypothetical protein